MWGTELEEGCEKLGSRVNGKNSWRSHGEWELKGSREVRENIIGNDNCAHMGKGVYEPEEEALAWTTLYHDGDAGTIYAKPPL